MHQDEGFTLVELTVAMFVTLLVVSSLIGVFVGSLSGVALSKQRQAANALATGVMEQFRAVDYGTLSSGLYCVDLAGDSNVTVSGTCGGTPTATFAPPGSGINETVKLTTATPPAASPGIPPLYPHVSTRTVENVSYTVKAYVTNAATAQTAFNLTVLVTWSSSVSKGTKTVTQRSLAYSPSRCMSSATHPYSGACQAAFNGDAGLTPAGITISNPTNPTGAILGFGGSGLELSWPSLSATLGIEQVAKLSGSAQAVGATVTPLTGGPSATGGAVASVSTDTDPSTVSNGVSEATLSQSGAASLSIAGAAGSLAVVPTTADTGSLDARTSSTATSCQDGSGTVVNTVNRPCIWGTVQTAGSSAGIQLNLANGLPNFSLASLAPAGSPARASVARLTAAANGACPSTSGVGCISSQARRAPGAMSFGGLPTAKAGDTAPAGFTGSLISVSGLQEVAYAEAGLGVRAPSFTRAGTVSYYNPATSSYASIDVATLTADFAASLGTISGTYFQSGHRADISVEASLRVGANAAVSPMTSAPDATCKAAACSAVATGSSALVANLIYTVVVDGMQSTTFAMNIDLGSVLAKCSYKAAFDA